MVAEMTPFQMLGSAFGDLAGLFNLIQPRKATMLGHAISARIRLAPLPGLFTPLLSLDLDILIGI